MNKNQSPRTLTRDIFGMAIGALLANKVRSALTALGIIIGVAAIIIVMSIGNAAQALILQEVQSFGARNVFISPGRIEGNNPMSAAQSVLSQSLKQHDIDELENPNNVPDAVLVSPSVEGSVSATYEDQAVIETVLGSGASVFDIYNLTIAKGSAFTQTDVDSYARVAVIGKNVAKKLFGANDPIGKKIGMKDQKFTVVGVFSSLNASMFGIDDMIVVPYTAAQEYLLGGIRYFNEVVVQARTVAAVPGMVKDIQSTLRSDHNITDPAKDDFTIQTQEDMMRSIDTVFMSLTAFLSLVAAISLLVGGVGVMNIMFVSVTERTREIGLRKALGATNGSILLQFLIEALLLSVGGGIIGIIVGLSVTALAVLVATRATGIVFPFVISWVGVGLGVGVSAAIGLAFGVFPARSAAQKSPVEALRYE
jgi:putative ABC transport system permease protein